MGELRKLSSAELALARFAAEDGNWRVGSFIELEGPAANDVERLSEVLTRLQQRHPLLRVVMTVNKKKISWKYADNYRIPIITTQGDKFEAYCKYTQESLKSGDGIMRVLLVQNEAEQKSTFIPLIDHFASDGMCYTNMINEILLGWSRSPEFDDLSMGLEVPESCEVYANRSFAGSYLKKLATEAKLLPKIFDGSTYTWRPKREEGTDGERQLFHFDELSPDDTKAVLKACRANGTTITGLVGAVFAEMYAKLVHERAVKSGRASADKETTYKVSQSLAFDLRRLYNPNIAREGVSFHVGFGMPLVLSAKSDEMKDEETWNNARIYKDKLSSDQKGGITVATALLAGTAIPVILKNLKYCDLFFTNWGLLPIKTDYNGLKVTGFVGGINSVHIPFPVIIASSFNKKLGFTVQAPREYFDEAFITEFHKAIMGRIEEIVRV